MNNDEVVAAFAEFLEIDPQCTIFPKPATAQAVLREFANAIDPVPLEEVTEQEIKIFLRDRKVPTVAVRPLPLSEAHARARMEKAKAALRYSEYQLSMECFRLFRRSVLKSRRTLAQA
jgi:hypothetical protein